MKEFKGTPGRWIKRGDGIVAPGDIEVAVVVNFQDDDVMNADANLIAAAPELLEVLTYCQPINLPDMLDWVADRLVNVHGENGNLDFILSLRERARIARAAIAKALGETK